MRTISIKRVRAAWQDRARDYLILLDGSEVGRVSNGTETNIAVNPGKYTISLKVDWCYSPELGIEIAEGETLALECGPNANPFNAFLYILFRKQQYLWLNYAN